MIQVREREVSAESLLLALCDRLTMLPQTMFAGVIRDEERLAAKRAQKERQLEFEDQARKRAYLEQVQSVSQASVPPPDVKGEVPKSADGLDFGCKTCER